MGSSAVVPHDSNGCRNGCDGAHESCKPLAINRKIAVGPRLRRAIREIPLSSEVGNWSTPSCISRNFAKSIRIYSASASPSYFRHMRFVLQIGKFTWMRPIAKGRSRPFQRRLDQTISTVSRGVLDLRSVRNAYIT
jgi:hypothetical protein